MSDEPMFGNWLVAVAEAAGVTGASELDAASVAQMTKAWSLVMSAAGITRDDLTRRMAAQAELEVADLENGDTRTAVLIPSEVAHRRNVLPLRCSSRDVWVATANPLSQNAKRELAALTGRSVIFEVAPPDEIATQIEVTYGALSDEERTRAPAGDNGAGEPEGPHILVVDDEIGQRTLLRSVLEEAGFRVDVVNDGPSAVAFLGDHPGVDLVTLDYWMDKMNGLRVLQNIRAHPELRTKPVIMVTGADDRRIEMSLFEAGADDYVPKPIDAPLFVLRVQAVLRRRGYR